MGKFDEPTEMLGTGSGNQTAVLETLASAAPESTVHHYARGHTLGRYVVLDVLGEGGMGVVYSAFDPDLDRRVAIKVMRNSASRRKRSEAGRTRLLREAKAMAKLNHPNVISVYDVGPVDDAIFLAMEFVDGETLRDRIKAADSKLTPEEALGYFLLAGEGLAVAHEAGLVHRDFKPENVMVARDGRVVVLDFGLAAPSSEEFSSASSGQIPADLTATGDIMGTPAYMSPEQITGSAVDVASDQFSFCVGLYEALYGERPFKGRSFDELRGNLISASLPREPEASAIPRRVRRALDKGLSRLPDDRFPSMRALLDALTEEAPRRRPGLVFALGAVAVAAAAGVAVAMRPATATPCAAVAGAMDDAWDPARADAVRAGFGRQPQHDAETTGEFVATALDDYAARWRAQRVDACAANQVRRDESDLLYSSRLVCLEGRLAAFGTLAAALASPDAFAIERGTRLVAELPSLELCSDAKYLMADVAPPSTPQLQADVAAIKRDGQAILARARQQDKTANDDSAALTKRAGATGYEPVLAHALVNEAKVASILHDDPRVTERKAFAGLLSAELAGDDRLILDALVLMADYSVGQSNNGNAADQLARADVVLRRLGDPTVLRLAWLNLSGKAAHASLNAKRALGYLEQGRELRRESGTWESVWAIDDEHQLAQAYTSLSRLDDARRSLEHALALCKTHLGPKHRAVASTYLLLGNLELKLANPKAALEHYDRAKEVGSNVLGYNQAYLEFQRANAKYLVGDLRGAEAKMREAIELGLKTRGEDHSNTAAFRANFGTFLLQRGRPKEALPWLERARRTFAEGFEDDHPTMQLINARLGDYHRAIGDAAIATDWYRKVIDVATDRTDGDARRLALTGLGEIEMGSGRIDDAVEHLEEAVGLNAPQDYERQQAFAQFALARALQQRGPQGTRARRLAEAARVDFAAMPTQPEALERVDTWLSVNPAGPR